MKSLRNTLLKHTLQVEILQKIRASLVLGNEYDLILSQEYDGMMFLKKFTLKVRKRWGRYNLAEISVRTAGDYALITTDDHNISHRIYLKDPNFFEEVISFVKKIIGE